LARGGLFKSGSFNGENAGGQFGRKEISMKHARSGIVDMRTPAISWLRSTGFGGNRNSVHFPTFKSICTVTVYTFSVRDGRTGGWRTSRHKMTLAEAVERYGKGNYEVIEDSKEVRWRRPLKRIFRLFK
jgi:hypothetical protein